jgi:isocitrate dehydrogenase
MYWAQELAAQNDNPALQQKFAPVAKELEANVEKILEELKATKGKPMDVGGYYHPDPAKVEAAMRPSATLNNILAILG